jgi:hypothetical protein
MVSTYATACPGQPFYCRHWRAARHFLKGTKKPP